MRIPSCLLFSAFALPLQSVKATFSSHHRRYLGFVNPAASLKVNFFHSNCLVKQQTSLSLAADMTSEKKDSPSAQRNKAPIWEVLDSKLFQTMMIPQDSKLSILEIAAGCGVHVEYFASKLASSDRPGDFDWYPTDPDEIARNSISQYILDGSLESIGVRSPLPLTLDSNGIAHCTESTGSQIPTIIDLMLCINMIHISPWSATLGLFRLAKDRLHPESGFLFCYGPYKENGTAVESNLNFDQNLKERNSKWGVRELEKVCKAASEENLELVEKIEMPANNLGLIFRKKRA